MSQDDWTKDDTIIDLLVDIRDLLKDLIQITKGEEILDK